ncbi:MAG: sensor histidine kinase [Balneolaceae bacterium]
MRWLPFTIDFLLLRHGIGDFKSIIILCSWMLLIAVGMISVLFMAPESWVVDTLDRNAINNFFLLYPPLIIGVVLLFWLGFEWGFIPVFLATFVIAFSSAMPVYWALLFGIAFILGLLIYALAYYCVPVDVSLRDLKSFAFFTMVSFVAAIASSLGSFIWSFVHNLSAAETMILWRGWWTGVFLQSMVIVAPLLFLFTPLIDRLRREHLEVPDRTDLSMKWIYGAIFSVATVLSLFIIGAYALGNEILYDLSLTLPVMVGERMLQANESFQVITWISIILVLALGLGGIYIVGTWNRQLVSEVEEKTGALLQSEAKLKSSLHERNVLLQGIHDRMRNNLTIILALLELQVKSSGNRAMEEVLKDAHSRLRSLALIHETMHQTRSVDSLNLKVYTVKLFNRLHQSFKHRGKEVETRVSSDEIYLDIDRALPFAMILNEILVNAYQHAFKDRPRGVIQVVMEKGANRVMLEISDDGVGLPDDLEQEESRHLGMKLIRILTRQIQGTFEIRDKKKTTFRLTIPNQKRNEPDVANEEVTDELAEPVGETNPPQDS